MSWRIFQVVCNGTLRLVVLQLGYPGETAALEAAAKLVHKNAQFVVMQVIEKSEAREPTLDPY